MNQLFLETDIPVSYTMEFGLLFTWDQKRNGLVLELMHPWHSCSTSLAVGHVMFHVSDVSLHNGDSSMVEDSRKTNRCESCISVNFGFVEHVYVRYLITFGRRLAQVLLGNLVSIAIGRRSQTTNVLHCILSLGGF